MLISVIIITYKRCRELSNVLESLLVQKKTGDFGYEVIVVDNNSRDETKQTVESFVPKFAGRSLKLKYLLQEIPGKSVSLNKALLEAKGDIMAFTDDDAVVDAQWLSCLARCFKEQQCDGVGGRVLPVYSAETPLWVKKNPVKMAGVIVIYDQGPNAHPIHDKTERFIGCNWAFKKSVFEECGPFCTTLGPGTPIIVGEDEEFFYRVVDKKKKLYYCPEAFVLHPVDLKRLGLVNAAKWHISLGRFEAIKEMRRKLDFICYVNVPRYLVRSIIVDVFKLPFLLFNRLAFWNNWRSLFTKIGMIRQYQVTPEKIRHA